MVLNSYEKSTDCDVMSCVFLMAFAAASERYVRLSRLANGLSRVRKTIEWYYGGVGWRTSTGLSVSHKCIHTGVIVAILYAIDYVNLPNFIGMAPSNDKNSRVLAWEKPR